MDPPEHIIDEHGKLRLANREELWKAHSSQIAQLTPEDNKERQGQKKVRRNIEYRERHRDAYNKRTRF